LLVGILVARSVAGILAELGDSWTTVYRVSAVAMVIVALALWRVLPATPPVVRQGYGSTLRSLGTLIVTHPRLRTRTLLGGLGFASVGALFSTMAFLLSDPPFGLDDLQIGLVGLAGVAGAFAATAAGRLVDRGYGLPTTAVGMFTLIASWAALAAGASSLVWFVVGMLVVDLALNLVHITNQNIVYALDPDARSRVNSVYMTGYFIGAASGSALGTMAWSAGGWTAVCVLGVGLAALAGVVWALDLRLTARMRARSARVSGGPAAA
ncbi:MFS transporter, partial [Rhodococcus pyridinivorans]|uniref:MFS transporter n=2 Tax=Nocardiaceae TaxID=85025 RepID=UPI0024B8DF49